MRTQSTSSLISTFKSISKAASVIVILVGSFVLVGWTLDIDVLRCLPPCLLVTNPTTATTFVLAGSSLRLLLSESADQKLYSIARGLAFTVTLMGLLKITEVLLGADVGIDNLLVWEKV